MKKSLFLLFTTISLHSICQIRIAPYTEVCSSKTTSLRLCNSKGDDSITKTFEPGLIHLIDLNNKKRGKILKGEVIATLLRDNEVFYALYSDKSELKFNNYYKPIIDGWNFFSDNERIEFIINSNKYNNDFYDAIRKEKQKLIDEENRIILKEKQRIEDSINKRKELFDKYREDSIKSISFIEESRLVKDYSNRTDSIHKAWIDRGNANGGVLISTFENFENSIGYHDVTFGILNCTKKRIKYVSASFKAFNSVNDQVGGIQTLKGIGFINPGESGEWEFENVWYSSIINSASIVSIKVTYEDGSVKTVTNIPKLRIDNKQDGLLKVELENYLYLRDNDNYKFVGFVKSIEIKKSPDGFRLMFYDINSDDVCIIEVDGKFISDANEIIEKINSGTKPFYNSTFSINEHNTSIYMGDETGRRIVLWIDDLKELLRVTSEK